MNDPNQRPDPDELLQKMQRERDRETRGKLWLFFGFAPGVGKTFRMLSAAKEYVTKQKRTLLVGVVETHQRRDTTELLSGLEILPKKKTDYRGRSLEEFDLETALAKKPDVILVDELAHTNAPGLRHAKRWQDVEELLAAGIDVWSTMNVQHVESLNDVVAQITHVQVRETVPDSVIDKADRIELVDIAPEELLQRLNEGKVYLGEQAARAAEHFFRRGNLLALRELALRRTAQIVDDDVREYRQEHHVTVPWPASERILVCVGPSPSSGRLIRAAARMAAGLRCPWVAVYVERSGLPNHSEQERSRLEGYLRLAESLGATVTQVTGANVAVAILDYARHHNVTRIVIGKPTHAIWRDRLRGSLLDEVVRGSGDIDIHVIRGDVEKEQSDRPSEYLANRIEWRFYLIAFGFVVVTVLIAWVVRTLLNLPDPEMLFLLTVMVSAVWFGRGPALFAAALGVACYDFFFVPPYYTFSVSDQRYFLTFTMMFFVGYVMSELAGRLKQQERDALYREQRTAVLYALTRELAATDVVGDICSIATKHASEVFRAKTLIVRTVRQKELEVIAAWPAGGTLEPKDMAVAKWVIEHGELAGLGTDTLPGAGVICAPLRIGGLVLGVLCLNPPHGQGLQTEQRSFLDVFCRQVAVALERARLSEEARASALRAKTEEMRSSLLSAVSHDLRTPLASITGAATVLRDEQNLGAQTRAELLEAICDQAERLERLVANLLDMTKVESGALSLKKDWVPVDELIGSSLTRLEGRLSRRNVKVALAADLPMILVDPVLIEQLFVNLLENADKYTPADSDIEIIAQRMGENIMFEVCDHGTGLEQGTEELVFEKFYRGKGNVGGAGLGLAICRGIVQAHNGQISAKNNQYGGATFEILLPLGGVAPEVRLQEPEA